MKHSKSEELFARALGVIPGGVNSPVRAFRGVGGNPVFIARGEGSHLFDVDGNEYIDYVGSWGPLLLGHRHPAVIRALEEALKIGTSFGAPTEREIELAEAISDAVPSMEMVRLVNSGHRSHDERDAAGARIHGPRSDGEVRRLLSRARGFAAGEGRLGRGHAGDSPIRRACRALLRYHHRAALQLRGRAGRGVSRARLEIASVIVEPVVGNMGCVPPAPGFLEALRELTTRHGALLIFDEVMTGFRVAFGGAQALYGIRPDLTTLGKVIGGGLPIGAYGGRADIMRLRVAPRAGLPGGHALGQSAGGVGGTGDAAAHRRRIRRSMRNWNRARGG